MKKTFRQSMAWLHTWAGLTLGWLLFFIFLTGTIGYVSEEVDRWMRPEAPLVSALPKATRIAQHSEDYLRATAANAVQWIVQFPGDRYRNELIVGQRGPSPNGRGLGELVWQTLDADTGAPISYESRETGGGYTLYWMHFTLHYVSRDTGTLIVGLCAMFMLVAIFSGIVTHRRIFTDLFFFRPGKGQRTWLDAHNVFGATALPFHLMIIWSGLIIFLFTYMPLGMRVLYTEPGARARFAREAFTIAAPPLDPAIAVFGSGARASTLPLSTFIAQTEKLWGEGGVASIEVSGVGRDNALVTVRGRRYASVVARDTPLLRFKGATGDLLPETPGPAFTAPGKFHSLMLALHEANFARPWLRALFLAAGLSGTALIATGLFVWSSKRKARLAEGAALPAHLAVIDAMNAGTILGLPIGVAAYFWANRLLPVGMDARGDWEMNSLFIVWGLMFLYAFLRPGARRWVEMPLIAAAAFAALPLLNALTTARHLGATIPAGDWVLAGFDLSTIVVGAGFATAAWIVARRASRSL
jgi:uncharacterized iron-regulated membrane protein